MDEPERTVDGGERPQLGQRHRVVARRSPPGSPATPRSGARRPRRARASPRCTRGRSERPRSRSSTAPRRPAPSGPGCRSGSSPEADRTPSGPNRAPPRNDAPPSQGIPKTAACTPGEVGDVRQPRVGAGAREARRRRERPRARTRSTRLPGRSGARLASLAVPALDGLPRGMRDVIEQALEAGEEVVGVWSTRGLGANALVCAPARALISKRSRVAPLVRRRLPVLGDRLGRGDPRAARRRGPGRARPAEARDAGEAGSCSTTSRTPTFRSRVGSWHRTR